MSSSSSTPSISDLTNLQNQAENQYITESESEVEAEMGSQQAQLAHQAADAWAKAQ
jgi:hypothetical protein